ncbi:MAG: ABC transporter ATP-binding protein [Candidatus Omnitrophota bacterium]|nr:MAG: ABC transporter ATP-binding protein [Candidatus Omnitrophota bacterium]
MSENIIELRNLGKRYELPSTSLNVLAVRVKNIWALKDVTFEVKRGTITGIIGRNGAGKTTLLNIIAGTLSSSEGSLIIKGKVLGLFNLGVGFQDELSGKENIFLNAAILGARRREVEDKLDAIVEFSELGNFIHMPLGSYSQGMRLRLGFSIIANLEFDILVIDEVLAVGDSLFQSKCFQRLMEFKRSGKTLVITSQNMDLVRRLCDKVILLEHSRLLYDGAAEEGIHRYQHALATERFYVGQAYVSSGLVENTKKWAQDIEDWGKKLGTKEAVIEKVEFINRFGLRSNRIKTKDPLTIKVQCKVRNTIKDPHFGVAIFRRDGVYCYGPNTAFDGHVIEMMQPGKASFELRFKALLLAPGEYRFSLAIWDKDEALPFDYHNGCYVLYITGEDNNNNALLNVAYEAGPSGTIWSRIGRQIARKACIPRLPGQAQASLLNSDIAIDSVRLIDRKGRAQDVCMTTEDLRLEVKFLKFPEEKNNFSFWAGIYRDDGIYCQGVQMPIRRNAVSYALFPVFPLLPGDYVVRVGAWDHVQKKFILYENDALKFKMVFNHLDHGTVYLRHEWRWCIKAKT